MNRVQKLLYSEADAEIISLLAAMEKGDDIMWLADHGYYERKQWGGGLTEKGRAFIQKQNVFIEKLFNKYQSYFESAKYRKLHQMLLDIQKENGGIYDGLTEEERLAVQNIIKSV